MLRDYLQLDIEIKRGNWDILYAELQDNKIDIINFLTKTSEREKFAIFSNKILDEELVIVSKVDYLKVQLELEKSIES